MMMMPDATAQTLAGANKAISEGTRMTQNVTGNPTVAFAPKAMAPLAVPQAHPKNAGYGMAHQQRMMM